MRHQSFGAMLGSLSNQVASELMDAAIKQIAINELTKVSDAATAARKAYINGESVPGIGLTLGPSAAAEAFAAVMAFSVGTDSVPGFGTGDVVPAMLTPGEGVVPRGVMEGLRNVARNGGFDQKPSNTIHAHFAPVVSAMDAKGVDRVLTEHQDVFRRHLSQQLRRMNK